VPDPQLPGFLNSLAPYLKHYGYLAVAGIVTIESFGPPLPGETIIIAASIYAGAGSLNIWVVALVAFAAAVVGDNIGYLIGRKGGHALVERYGRYVGATPERYGKAEAFFLRNGRWIIIVARFIEGLRQLNGIIAGTAEMPWPMFAAAQAAGAALWVGTWTLVGYKAGSHITTIYDGFSKVGYGLFGVLVLLIVVLFIRRRRHKKQDAAPTTEETAVE
jgi:membrane protein DedA with SNARE-associated domain